MLSLVSILALAAFAVGEVVQHVTPVVDGIRHVWDTLSGAPLDMHTLGPVLGATVTISQGVGDVRPIPRQFLTGQRPNISDLDRTKTLINKSPQAYDIWTMAITATSTGTVYTWTLNGVVQTYTQLAGDTTSTILAASIAAYINQQPLTRGQVAATAATGTVTLTSTYPGLALTITESDANIGAPSHSTTAAGASLVSFGKAVCKTGWSADVQPAQYGAAAATALFTAQIATVDIVYGAADVYTVGITFQGVTVEVNVAANTDSATTATDIATALNAIMPANTVDITRASAKLSLTSEIVGEEFSVYVGSKSGTATRTVLTLTVGPSGLTSFNRAFAGVSVYSQEEQSSPVTGTGIGGSTGGYPANSGMICLNRGQIAVDTTQTILDGDPVYVELGATNNAQFFNTSGTTRALVSGAKWVRGFFSNTPAAADNVGVIELNVPFA